MPADKDEGLKRLGGGRWQTRDERFTIEPQSGTWAVVDAEQTDDLGLPLVRGPFGSLGAAKEAIAAARDTDAPASPLKDRTPKAAPTASKSAAPRNTKKAVAPKEPEEPRWLRDLDPADRRRATRLIDRLMEAGAPDPEGMVRRDVIGEVPTIAAFAVARAIRALGPKAAVGAVADALGDGRDTELNVRWRLVDGDGREIRLDPEAFDDD